MVTSYIWLAVLSALLLYSIVIYNGLAMLKHNVARSWSKIDVLLKQRHDEIHKLVEACKQYMQFEKQTLERVMLARTGIDSAREKGDVKAVGDGEGALRSGIAGIAATVEAHPELKANQPIQQLLDRITGLENAISDRRKFYNESVNLNNVRIQQFPDVIIARLCGFQQRELLEFSGDGRKDVDVSALFRSR